MSGVNKVILVGRLGGDPEVKIYEDNKFAKFSLATSEKYKNKAGELVEKTDWHIVVVWGKLAEIVEKYIKKGGFIYLEGKIQTRSYEKDGNKQYITEVVAKEIVMLGGKSETDKNTPSTEKGNPPSTPNIPM